MRPSRLLKLGLSTAVLAAMATAAGAQTSGTTEPLFQLVGGALTLTAPTASGTPASGAVNSGTNITATLGNTTVSDQRSTFAGWTVTATATDLREVDENGDLVSGGATIARNNLRWSTGTITATTGSMTGVSAGLPGFFGATPLVVASAAPLTQNGVWTYPADVRLTVPLNAKAARYKISITQSVQ